MKDLLDGTVVATFGRSCDVEDRHGETRRCVLKGRRLRPVCADRVRWESTGDEGGRVVAILDRRNELSRPDSRGRTQVLASNLDEVIIVCAPSPAPDPFLLDRYVACAELMPANVVIAFNKTDLPGHRTGPLRRRGFNRVECGHISALSGTNNGGGRLDDGIVRG